MNRLSNLSQYQQTISFSNSASKDGIVKVTANHTEKGNQLQPGETIQGEVINVDGSNVKLKLSEGNVLNARMDQEIQMLLGQKMLFSVKGNADGQISLNPLFENMARQETGSAALKEAGMPLLDQNMKLVSLMMQEGMSIDKSSLLQMGKDISMFPNVPVETLVQMNKLQIPVTEQNITQFQLYMENKNQLVQGVLDLMDQIPELYEQQMQNKDASSASQLLAKVFEQLVFQENGEGVLSPETGTVAEQSIQDTQNAADGKVIENFQQSDGQNSEQVTTETGLQTQKNVQITQEQSILQEQNQVDFSKTDSSHIDRTGQQEGLEQSKGDITDNQQIMSTSETNQSGAAIKDLGLNRSEMQELMQNMKDLGIDSKVIQKAVQGDLKVDDLMQNLISKLQSGNSIPPEQMKQLLESSGLKKVIQNVIEDKLLIKPQDVANQNGVTRFYEKMDRQMQQLMEIMQSEHAEKSPFAKNVQNMRANVNFMNDLNHMFTYVQLPLKLSQSHAHGDLYVYTNKKSLASHQKDISALLHLDMDYLGPMDVYVKLQNNQKVSTNFYVQDDETLDLIQEHIGSLNENLTKKGYTVSSNVQIREEEKEIMKEILQENKSNVPVAMYTFDARA